ncbi:MAG TPA: pyridoxamine 5'-phosphate oxidase family protein [Candidatus Omnitrophota bacterium]|nr:pyridoxamine 5'-phosphate oxidase family protein [Candidatus Omnitrophota bacterium]HQJ15580.1 pyridoxamine 5'-phosphate oxidase family protein [Candidatus Omnitrophota bacterium]
MKRLSDEVMDFFKDQAFVIVTTLDADGTPHDSCKDIVRLSRDGRIYLLDLYMRRTYQNLRKNPSMCIAQVDEHKFAGYCLKGTGRVVKVDRLRAQVHKVWQKKISSRIVTRIIRNLKEKKGHPAQPESLLPRPEYMIVMDVAEVIDLTPAHIKGGVSPRTGA